MKNNGFTLVELLAVIVVLGVIMAIAGTAVLGQRRKTNIEEAKKIEQTIADLGPGIYSYESSVGSDDSDSFMQFFNEGQPFKISQDTLISAGYLDGKIENPSGNGTCDAYLVVDPSSDDEMFKGYVDCSDLYATGQDGDTYDRTNYDEYTDNNVSDFLGNLSSNN